MSKKISALDPVLDADLNGSEALAGAKSGGNVKITVEQVADYHDRGEWDASGNLFPIQRGSGDTGPVKKNDEWIIVGSGDLGESDVEEALKLNLKALYDNPLQDESKWKIY